MKKTITLLMILSFVSCTRPKINKIDTVNNSTSNNSNGSNYCITASSDNNGVITPSGQSFLNKGDEITYEISPNKGYDIDNVSVDGIALGKVISYTFNDISANHIITASFISNRITNIIISNMKITPTVTSNYAYIQQNIIYLIKNNQFYLDVSITNVGASIVSNLHAPTGESILTCDTPPKYPDKSFDDNLYFDSPFINGLNLDVNSTEVLEFWLYANHETGSYNLNITLFDNMGKIYKLPLTVVIQ